MCLWVKALYDVTQRNRERKKPRVGVRRENCNPDLHSAI